MFYVSIMMEIIVLQAHPKSVKSDTESGRKVNNQRLAIDLKILNIVSGCLFKALLTVFFHFSSTLDIE